MIMAKSNRTSNDQRSTVKNQTSKEFAQDKTNTAKQVKETQPKKGK